ncbi:hypothetical protein JNW90_18425 [Micromonospora sp. STR1s_5]|nr:hypothetical protein [Micromonospora sp. STR1s_5]
MTVSHPDLAHLEALIEAAKAHAVRLGPEVRGICSQLDQASAFVRELQSNGGKADEGLRPQDLTTQNDE